MTRKDLYRKRQQEFIKYIDESKTGTEDKDKEIDIYNRDYTTELLCDLTDAMCEIAKSLEGIKAELCQIRRQMPR